MCYLLYNRIITPVVHRIADSRMFIERQGMFQAPETSELSQAYHFCHRSSNIEQPASAVREARPFAGFVREAS